MRPGIGLIIWESALTFSTTVTGGLGLADMVPPRAVALAVLIVQGLNAATIVFKTGQWAGGQAAQSGPAMGVHRAPDTSR